ncbi:elongation factor G [Methylocystis heyeri]|uniref:Elongation factor G n=1 Tax=Methylocystis heyeri TaxID=391905 RepID=A0A6B8KA34_9HYPH|nr:elongation factor G [Methylocystis heyeri]QGM44709.1 elongation factor G [Methylocystis heyeri]
MGANANDHGRRIGGPRLVALIGPFQSGKSKLFEALLARVGAAREGVAAADLSPEAKAHQMSVEANIGHADYLGDQYTFIDIPGSLEFSHEARYVLPLVDAAVVVCEADPRKVFSLQLVLRELEELKVPHFLFLNKVDSAAFGVREALAMLQPASRTPLLLRQIPIWKNGVAIGFIDLALERAYVYREHAPSEVVAIPAGDAAQEKEERYSMLERLADYDDHLMEELIAEIEPPRDEVFDDLAKELQAGQVVPLFIGSALRGAGVTRLLKALRHEAPGVVQTRARLGVADKGPPLARVLRTIHTTHGGKLSLARVLRGTFVDGQAALSPGGEDKISGFSRLLGGAVSKRSEASEGDTLAFGHLENAATGDSLSGDPRSGAKDAVRSSIAPPAPVHALALKAKDRKDEMKLASAIAKLVDEDPALVYVHDQAMSEIKLLGQGEMHLRVALERLASRFGVAVEALRPAVAYKETIRKSVAVRGRHKKQSGGHGQFGDVALEVAPRPRGSGFAFSERVHGGAVPRQYFSSVEAGCADALAHGPLGFPVVDVEAVLTDGSYHTVDSSDMAFRTAARIGMSEALALGDSVLLEPMLAVTIYTPSEGMSRATGIVSGRRGQILGFGPREGWDGWDRLEAIIPEAEMDNLIVELRSATAGAGFYEARFDHLAEVTGRLAREVVAAHGGRAHTAA